MVRNGRFEAPLHPPRMSQIGWKVVIRFRACERQRRAFKSDI